MNVAIITSTAAVTAGAIASGAAVSGASVTGPADAAALLSKIESVEKLLFYIFLIMVFILLHLFCRWMFPRM